jgi:hypothetical protein
VEQTCGGKTTVLTDGAHNHCIDGSLRWRRRLMPSRLVVSVSGGEFFSGMAAGMRKQTLILNAIDAFHSQDTRYTLNVSKDALELRAVGDLDGRFNAGIQIVWPTFERLNVRTY